MRMEINGKETHFLKYVSLITLTLQNAAVALSTRYSRTRGGEMYFATTAVLGAEVVKLVICLYATLLENGGAPTKWIRSLWNTVVLNPLDTFKVCIPAILYIVQNNLLYLAASHVDAATYQVIFQLKILFTAIFSITMLRRRISLFQWISLVLLLFGVALVQLAQMEGHKNDTSEKKVTSEQLQNKMLGSFAVFVAACISGFAGIYFEKMLKGANISVWMRNVQLSLCSVPFGIIACVWKDFGEIKEKGFFYGYDAYVIYIVVLHAGGGLLVAMVMKYADSIVKCFASGLAIVIACVISALFFDLQMTVRYVLGTAMVIISTFLYSYKPPAQEEGTLPCSTITKA